MISKDSIQSYKGGRVLSRSDSFLYIAPHIVLQPYISNYTVSFPTPQTMPEEYTIIPTASATLVLSVDEEAISCYLRGINTKPCIVGKHANRKKLLLLIEFHPGGLYPFIPTDQVELMDVSYNLKELDHKLFNRLEEELIKANNIEALVGALNRIWIERLEQHKINPNVIGMRNSNIEHHGIRSNRELVDEFHYSEKQIKRLFLQYIGTGPKMFSRIVRTNYALHILQKNPSRLTEVAVQAGYFDQPHFIHDFKRICNITPQEYRKNMSYFYNDRFKM